jgi:hypothetical protein
MGDPLTAGVVGSVIAPELGASLAAPVIGASALGIAPEFAPLAMSGNPLVNAIGTGIGVNPFAATGQIVNSIGGVTNPVAGGYGANGESLFGFDTTGKGIGQGIMEQLGQANKWMNQNPVTTQLGMKAASSLLPQQQHIQMAPQGQVSRGQVQPMDYMSLLNPQQPTVIRPQPISLI